MDNATLQFGYGLDLGWSDKRAVNALLKQPALTYMRTLRLQMDEDPDYLIFHECNISRRIQTFLTNRGIFWDDSVMEREFNHVVQEAVGLLRRIEM